MSRVDTASSCIGSAIVAGPLQHMEKQETIEVPTAIPCGPVAIIPDAIYLTEEAARVARVEPSTIRAAVRTGKIRATGRPFRIRGSELFKLA